MHDRVGVALEHRATALDDVGVATDHHQQTALGHCRRTTAHWCIDNRDTLRGSLFSQTVTCLWVHGAVHGDHTTRLEPGQHSVLTRGDVFDIGVADDAQADEIAGGRELRR